MTSAIETGVNTLGVPGPVVARLAELPAVNLMPPEIAERAALQQVKVLCGGAVVLSAVIVGGLWYQAHSGVNSAKSALTTAQGQQSSVQAQISSPKLQQVAQTYTEVSAAKVEVTEALGGEIRWSTKLDDLSLSMPKGVWLTSMSVAAGPSSAGALVSTGINSISFAGIAETRDDVAGWLNSLAQEHGYINPYVTSTALGTNGEVTFSSTVTGTSALLSNRYTNLNGS